MLKYKCHIIKCTLLKSTGVLECKFRIGLNSYQNKILKKNKIHSLFWLEGFFSYGSKNKVKKYECCFCYSAFRINFQGNIKTMCQSVFNHIMCYNCILVCCVHIHQYVIVLETNSFLVPISYSFCLWNINFMIILYIYIS